MPAAVDGRRLVAGIGRTLIAAGVLILLFVAYQLWGTGLAERRSQRALREDFRASLLAAPTPATTTTAAGAAPAPTTTAKPLPPPPVGAAVAVLQIPKIDVEKAIVQGVGVPDLKKGPGHYPTTPMPGQPGNAAIAGHRTTYGAPFFRLDELAAGDPIFVTTRQGKFRYEVMQTQVVSPSQTEVLDATPDNRLTLTTCNPRFSAKQRLIVVSRLVGEAADAPPPPPPPPADSEAGPGSEPRTTTPATLPAFEGERSLSGDPAARWPALGWALACALVALAGWVAARRWRRLPAYLLAAPAFLVVLYLFFENVARLFPANV